MAVPDDLVHREMLMLGRLAAVLLSSTALVCMHAGTESAAEEFGVLNVAPSAGGCPSQVMLTGVGFPPTITLMITAPPYGTDSPGSTVATVEVRQDGGFEQSLQLAPQVCSLAPSYPDNAFILRAYDASQPLGLSHLGETKYRVTPGEVRVPPPVGSGARDDGPLDRRIGLMVLALTLGMVAVATAMWTSRYH